MVDALAVSIAAEAVNLFRAGENQAAVERAAQCLDHILNAESAECRFQLRFAPSASNNFTGPARLRIGVARGIVNIEAPAELVNEDFSNRLHAFNTIRLVHTTVQQRYAVDGDVVWDIDDSSEAGNYPRVAFSSNLDAATLVIDPHFVRSSGYREIRNTIHSNWLPWEQRKPIVFWRGSTTGRRAYTPADMSPIRDWRWLQRLYLCDVVARSHHAPQLDIGVTSFPQLPETYLKDAIVAAGFVRPHCPKREFINYRYIVDIDGNANAWEGLITAMLMGATIFKVASPSGCRQWYYDRLVPWTHYVPVRADLSDLNGKIQWAFAHPEDCAQIGHAAKAFADDISYEREINASADAVAQLLTGQSPNKIVGHAKQPVPQIDAMQIADTAGSRCAPILIMSFNRPYYLARVLESLKHQRECDIENRRIVLFQDGAFNHFSNTSRAEAGHIDESVAVFRSIFPDKEVMQSDRNLGVALNFNRAEEFAFETLNATAAIFLEDDLVLGPHYIATIDRLVKKFNDDERVGYIAAYGNHTKSISEQLAHKHELISLYHNWGFALYQRQWRKMRNHILEYLELLRDVDYVQRDHKKIFSLFASWGFHPPASSQDSAKTTICCMDGVVKLNSFICNAKYIGERGIHMTPTEFAKQHYGQTELFNAVVEDFCEIDDSRYHEILNEQLAWAGAPPRVGNATDLEPKTEKLYGVKKVQREKAGMRVRDVIMQKLYGGNIWEGFQPVGPQGSEIQGWNGNHPSLARLTAKSDASTIVIDVGVWKGQSTITMANAMKRNEVDGCVIAVDTFLGSVEHWNRALFGRSNGLPDLYRSFLENVYYADLTDYVIPLPQTSISAAAILNGLGISAGVVHIDAAHEYRKVLRDAEEYWKVLAPGGWLIGDDYHETWPGVVQAAGEFSSRLRRPLTIEPPKWLIQKL